MGANALESIAANEGLMRAKGLFGIYNFEGGPQRYAELMTAWLARAPAAAILMCHPAQAAEPGDEIGIARAQEFAYLASREFADALQQARVAVVRGRDVLAQATR
jgi:hypothetical protein